MPVEGDNLLLLPYQQRRIFPLHIFYSFDAAVFPDKYQPMVCGCAVHQLRPCDDFKAQFCMRKGVSETSEECAVHILGNKVVNDVSIAWKDFQFYLNPDLFER